MTKTSKIELSKETREALARALKDYLKDELEVEITGFGAQFLLDFIAERIGPRFYNQGLQDAQVLFRAKVELITEAIYELETPVKDV
ncbi:DUF2164 domain-containing protein [Phenylobacterium sp.]|uniref:DUF2164 domain-containing protein n=1 Tax=Phenylobacterium sp. TaxID=1871053 RepID=UPI002DE8DC21|nr:DUF2164 domain-containing protein [Phenylobacterium sp.]